MFRPQVCFQLPRGFPGLLGVYDLSGTPGVSHVLSQPLLQQLGHCGGMARSGRAPVLSPWTKAVCTHVISTNYPGFSKLAADSQLDSQAAQSYCPCTSALSKSLGPALISKPSTSPPLAHAPLGLCCCHVLTSDLLCVFASIRLEWPLGQVRKATLRRAKARVLCCEGRQRQRLGPTGTPEVASAAALNSQGVAH